MCPQGQPRLSLTTGDSAHPCPAWTWSRWARYSHRTDPSPASAHPLAQAGAWCLGLPQCPQALPWPTRNPGAPSAPGGCWQGGEAILDTSSRQNESTEISTALQECFLHDPKKKTDNFLTYAINLPNWLDEDIFSTFLKNTVNSRKTSIPSEEPHAQGRNKCRLP